MEAILRHFSGVSSPPEHQDGNVNGAGSTAQHRAAPQDGEGDDDGASHPQRDREHRAETPQHSDSQTDEEGRPNETLTESFPVIAIGSSGSPVTADSEAPTDSQGTPEVELTEAAGREEDPSVPTEIEVPDCGPEGPGASVSVTVTATGFDTRAEADLTLEDIPPMFICPITMQIMRHPVLLPSGQTFEKSEIWRWLKAGNLKCPTSGVALEPPVSLVPNFALRQSIEHWCSEYMPSLLDTDGKVRLEGEEEEFEEDADQVIVVIGNQRRGSPRSSSRRRHERTSPASHSRAETSRGLSYWSAFFLATILVAVFLGEMAADGWQLAPLSINPHLGPPPDTMLRMGAAVTAKLQPGNEWLRVVSASFLSAGAVHLGASLLSIAILCPGLIDRSSNLAVLAVFASSAMAGVIVSANMAPEWVIVASSAGVFGLIGASWAQLFAGIPRPDEFVAVLLSVTGISAFVGLMPFTDNWGHLGAAFVGFLLWCAVVLGQGEGRPTLLTRVGQTSFMLSVWIMILFFVVALVYDLRLSERCSWCHNLTCVETRWWTCQQMAEAEVMSGQVAVPSNPVVIRWQYDQGLCLDGNTMKMWDCTRSGFMSYSQKWRMGSAGGSISLDGTSLCLDNSRGRLAKGNPVQLYSCSVQQGMAPSSQGWSMSPSGHLYLTEHPGWCVSVDKDSGAVGLAPCDSSSAAQRFDLGALAGAAAVAPREEEPTGFEWPQPASTSFIMLRGSAEGDSRVASSCLGLGHGGLLNFDGCGTGFQHWQSRPGGVIQLVGTDKCLDNYLGRLKRGNSIRLGTCKTGEGNDRSWLRRQAWEVRPDGRIALKEEPRWCMSRRGLLGPSFLNAVELSQCNPNDPKQTFAFGDFSDIVVVAAAAEASKPSSSAPALLPSGVSVAMGDGPAPAPALPSVPSFRIVYEKHPHMCLMSTHRNGMDSESLDIHLWECDDPGGGYAEWELLLDGLVRLKGTYACMAVPDGGFRSHGPIRLEECSVASSGQTWSYTYERLIRSAARPEFCVDKNNRNDENGQALILYRCNARNSNQVFVLQEVPSEKHE